MSDLTTTFTNIANAIRSKTGSSDTMTPSEMPNEIAEIETPMDSINITQNGTYEPSAGRGYNQVIVEVPAPTLITKTIAENGTYNASSDNADGYSQVTVAVDGFKKKSISNTPTDIASFNDGTANPMPSLKISIEPVQSGSGDPSPSNVRPISGWSGANVTKCGVNLVNSKITKCNISSNGVLASANEYDMQIAYVKKGKTYTAINSDTSTPLIAGFFTDIPAIGSMSYNQERVIVSGGTTITAPIDGYIAFRTANNFNGAQLELGSTATTFSPYQGSTVSVSFTDGQGQSVEVFGGECDVVNGGEQPMTKVKVIEDGTKGGWVYNPERKGFYKPLNFAVMGDEAMKNGNCQNFQANWLKTFDEDNTGDKTGIIFGLYNQFVFVTGVEDIAGTTVNEWNAYLANHPLQLVYELATPTTFYTQPTSIKPLNWQNNIFADCGQILEGEYFVTL